MADYIEREATIKELLAVYEREFPTASGAFDEFATKILPDVITSIPTADVAPVRRGHWIIKSGYVCGEVEFECSCCCETEWRTNEMEYCPNCGAKMEGGDHDD